MIAPKIIGKVIIAPIPNISHKIQSIISSPSITDFFYSPIHAHTDIDNNSRNNNHCGRGYET